MPKTLIILTATYPLGGITEESFLSPELPLLAAEFDRVVIVPEFRAEDEPQFTLPAGIELDTEFAGHPSMMRKLIGLFDPAVWRALYADRKQIKSRRQLRADIAESIYTRFYSRKMKSLVRRLNLNPADTVFYSFWFNYITMAALSIPSATVVTRAHGHDLYETQTENTMISRYWRRRALSALTACYPCSESGTNYLKHNYPEFADKFHTAYLGSRHVAIPARSEASPVQDISLLCIARLSPIKRIPRQLGALAHYARLHPDINIHWTHIGDGADADKLRKLIPTLPHNLTAVTAGALSNEDVHRFLARNTASSHPFNALLLTSSSEGLPVTLMEAQSYGIPIIATDVGGVAEVCSKGAGILLPRNFSNDEFATALHAVMENYAEMSDKARSNWEEKFDSETLRKRFVGMLKELPNNTGI